MGFHGPHFCARAICRLRSCPLDIYGVFQGFTPEESKDCVRAKGDTTFIITRRVGFLIPEFGPLMPRSRPTKSVHDLGKIDHRKIDTSQQGSKIHHLKLSSLRCKLAARIFRI